MRHSLISGFAALVAIAAAAPAFAAEGPYVFMGVTPKHKVGAFFDSASVVRDGDIATTRFMAAFRDEGPGGSVYLVVRTALDCRKKASRNLGGAFYKADGSVVLEDNNAEPGWTTEQDEMGEAIMRAACSNALPAKAPEFGTIPEAVGWFRSGGDQ